MERTQDDGGVSPPSPRTSSASGEARNHRSQRWPWRLSVARASPASLIKEAREEKMLSGRLQRLPSVAWSSQGCVW
jgi:hypothetical protein